LFEFFSGESGRTKDFTQETDALFKGIAAGFDRERECASVSGSHAAAAATTSSTASATTAADLHIEAVHFLLKGLAIESFRAGHEHGLEHTGCGGLAFQGFFVAEAEGERHGDGFAACFHGKEPDAETGFFEALSAGFEILGSGVKSFTSGDGGTSAVVLDDVGDGGDGGDGESLWSISWYEDTKSSVPLGEVGFGNAVDIIRGDGLKSIALEKKESPVAQSGG
jgi:hypothetical protein